MMIALYPTKKALAAEVGKPLRYVETSMFGPEYKPDGKFSVCNRPHSREGYKAKNMEVVREFYAEVTMAGGLIAKVK